MARDHVFMCFSQHDDSWLERLQLHLKPKVRSGALQVWDRSAIATGDDRRGAIAAALGRARVAVLGVSPDFLASDFIAETELPALLAATANKDLRIVWIPLRPSGVKDCAIWTYQAAWDPARPLSVLPDAEVDAALAQVSAEIVKAFGGAPAPDSPAESPLPTVAAATASAPDPLATRPLPELVATLEQRLIERARQADDVKRAALTAEIDALVAQVKQRGRVKEGDLVAGARLLKVIGNGNFGTIYLSRRESDGVTVATKVFHLDKITEGVMLWSFRRSIKAMRHLGAAKAAPPSIVRIHAAADDTLSFTMDHLPGGNLEDIGARGFSLEKKLEVFAEVCRAVAFAHEKGVIHRDIKPANVVLDERHRPVLTDFDISDIKYLTRLSVARGSLGTPVFAAPEQLEDGNNATERSDIYSLGRLLYYLLLERSPGYQIEADPSLANLAAFPAALVAIVRRATQHDPARRYATVAELISAVEAQGSRSAALRARWLEAVRWVRRSAALLVIFTLIVAAMGGFTVYQRRVLKETERQQKETEAQRQRAEQELVRNRQLMKTLDQLSAEQAKLKQATDELGVKQKGIEAQRAAKEQELRVLEVKIAAAPAGSPARKGLDEQRAKIREFLDGLEQQRLANERQLSQLRQDLARSQAAAEAARKENESRPPPPPAPSTAPAPELVPVAPPPDLAAAHRPGPYRPDMKRIPAGEFVMGSPADEKGRDDDETQHAVRLTSAFAMSVSEVTQEQYWAVTGESPSDLKCANCPVNSVSWLDAARYCNDLSKEEGIAEEDRCYAINGETVTWRRGCTAYRLPTEAEWECAARGGAAATVWAGTSKESELARYANLGDDLQAVMTHAKNGFGLYDMSGNVWEWVWDWFGNYEAESVNPTGPKRGDDRVIRGGSFDYSPLIARVAYRNRSAPSHRSLYLGIRVARSLP